MQVERKLGAPRLLFADPIMNIRWDTMSEWARQNNREIRIGALPFNKELTYHIVIPDNSKRGDQSYTGAGRTFELAFEDIFLAWAKARRRYDD